MTPGLRLLASLGLLLGLVQAPAVHDSPDLTLVDVPYGSYASPENPDSAEKLDLYAHAEAVAPQPVLIEIHGGGFQHGAKSDFSGYFADDRQQNAIDKAFLAGFAVVSIDYPLTVSDVLPNGKPNPHFPRNTFPRAAHSVRRAIQFVRSKAGEWNLDPGRVFLIGGSAGGNLGLWAAMTRDVGHPASNDPVKCQSSRPNGVVFLWTPTYLDPAHLLLPADHPEPLDYFGAKSEAAFAKLSSKKSLAASPAWRVTHKGGGATGSATMAQLNASMPLFGVYDGLDVRSSSSSYTFPLEDPHSAAFGLLMKEAFDAYAQATQDPAAHWNDFMLWSVNPEDPSSEADAGEAVVAWLSQHAGL
jgi:hypothetical protein